MPSKPDRPIHAMLPAQMSAPALREAVSRLEGRGVAGVVMPQVYGPPFVPLAAVAMASETLALGTGIAIALVRSPFETACSAIEVDRISGGRFTLGLGVGPRHWVDFFGADYTKPVSRVREVIEVVRHVERGAHSGKMEPFRGEFWQLAFEGYEPTAPPVRERIPIRVAALRERVCELVGECCDGLIGHPMWSVDYALGTAQDAVARGAARAGRDPSEIDFQAYVTVSIDADERRAIDLAKPFVAFYGGFAQYLPYYQAHGFEKEAAALSEAAKSMSCRAAAALVPDEMARAFVACGTPDQVRAWIEPLWQRASSIAFLPPSWGLSQQETAEKQAAIEDTLWPG